VRERVDALVKASVDNPFDPFALGRVEPEDCGPVRADFCSGRPRIRCPFRLTCRRKADEREQSATPQVAGMSARVA